MALTTPYLLLTVISVAFIILLHVRTGRHKTLEPLNAIDIIKILRKLIENIPKHRGMANALLQGDENFKANLPPLQAEISQSLQQLKNACDRLELANICSAMNNIHGKWTSLVSQVHALEPQKSFELHSELIEYILYFMEDVANDLGLYKCDFSGAELLICKLPRLTEVLGQARGIGTGVATKQHCDVSTRVKLKFLHQRIDEILANLFNEIPSSEQKLLAQYYVTQEHTKSFLVLLQDEIINSHNITIKSDEYYSRATDAIGSNFALFDMLLPFVTSSVNNMVQQSRLKNKVLQLTSMGISILSLCSLYVFST